MANALDCLLEGLAYNFGPTIMDGFNDPEVVEIAANPDGKIWIEKLGEDMECCGSIEAGQAKSIVLLMASSLSLEATVETPIVGGELPDVPPFNGARFEGNIPPIVTQSTFTIRKKASRVFSLEEYVDKGIMPAHLLGIIKEAVRDRQNIVVAGGTGSGKTTLTNALILALSELCPKHRLLIMEDTQELQPKSPNTVLLRTSEFVSMTRLLKMILRYKPDRILIGEVRDEASLDLLKSWNTGHPGGISTVHANSAEEVLERLEELTLEAGKGPKQKLIGRAVDLVLFIQEVPGGRRLTQAIRVKGYDPVTMTYKIEEIYNEL